MTLSESARAFRVLAISGSLRSRSSNTELLRAIARVAPDEFVVSLYDGLGELPHFNPDLDGIDSIPPATVAALRALVGHADAVLISTPEYAHGIPGSLKNALDWLVSGAEIPGKLVAVLMTSGRSVHAPAALNEVLRTMSARVVELDPAFVPLDGRRMDATAVLADRSLAPLLRSTLESLRRAYLGGP